MLYRDSPACNIVVTQPRRMAATSLAKRVAEEMGEPEVGQLVGYRIGNDAMASGDLTRITFLTSGWLLHRLISMPRCKAVWW